MFPLVGSTPCEVQWIFRLNVCGSIKQPINVGYKTANKTRFLPLPFRLYRYLAGSPKTPPSPSSGLMSTFMLHHSRLRVLLAGSGSRLSYDIYLCYVPPRPRCLSLYYIGNPISVRSWHTKRFGPRTL